MSLRPEELDRQTRQPGVESFPSTSGTHIDAPVTGLSTFADWTRGRKLYSWGTNFGAARLPFQRWRHFKEAFAPELVERAVREHHKPVKRCLDPFGGSGTTALACQFLGVVPATIEVNPFLADLIEAKLTTYDADQLARDVHDVLRRHPATSAASDELLARLPATFVEPGVKDRWIFDREVAQKIAGLLSAIESLPNANHRRLFRVVVGHTLIELSNVVVNGKGRRYRGGWQNRRRSASGVSEAFVDAAKQAILDIYQYGHRPCKGYEVRRGDCRIELNGIAPCDLAVFSPPYPNSFDYTDVYNVELWMLGYLTDSTSNQSLRRATISSHVQLSRDFAEQPAGSRTLDELLSHLRERRERLWDRRIPEMIGAYFADITAILDQLKSVITDAGRAWLVVGDSRYADVTVGTAQVIAELAPSTGWEVDAVEPCRSMRSSAQQGGRHELAETLIVLSRA